MIFATLRAAHGTWPGCVIQRSKWREEFHSFGARGSYFIYLWMDDLRDHRIPNAEQKKGMLSSGMSTNLNRVVLFLYEEQFCYRSGCCFLRDKDGFDALSEKLLRCISRLLLRKPQMNNSLGRKIGTGQQPGFEERTLIKHQDASLIRWLYILRLCFKIWFDSNNWL